MAQECEKLTTCGFFKKYGEVKDLACRGVHQSILLRW